MVHRTKFILYLSLAASGALGALVLAYIQSKRRRRTTLSHVDSSYDQKKAQLSQLFLERMRLTFNNNRKTAHNILRSTLSDIRETFVRIIPVEKHILSLKHSREDSSTANAAASRVQTTWETIKVMAVLRAIASGVSLAISHVFVSLQINIIARYLFLNHIWVEKQKLNKSFASETTEQPPIELSKHVQQQFLNYFGHFQSHGLEKIANILRPHVENHVGPLSLKQNIDASEISELINKIRRDAFGDIVDNIQQITLPPEDEDAKGESLEDACHVQCLIDELRDILESPPMESILSVSCDAVFNVFAQQIDHAFTQKAIEKFGTSNESGGAKVKLFFAPVLPLISNEVKSIFDDDFGNEYVTRLYDEETLTRYHASVFSVDISFFE